MEMAKNKYMYMYINISLKISQVELLIFHIASEYHSDPFW